MTRIRAAVRSAALALAMVLVLAATGRAQRLEIHFINVGQGDAALLITPEHKTMLVDAGPHAAAVVAELRRLHIDTLDLVVASHAHADHIGGLPEVMATTVVRNYMDNGVPTARTARLYRQVILPSGARYLAASARTITLGSVRVRVLPPPDATLRLPRQDQNNRSVGLVVQYGRFRALLAGDAQVQELGYWLRVDSVPAVTVLKVDHHGSPNGTTPDWVRRTRPGVAVVSVGRNNYGHPSRAVIAAWCAAGARVLRTDRNGTLIVSADTTGHTTVRALPTPAGRAVEAVSACGGGR